jgi:predicted MFS family arabinose efflux permease
MDSIHIIFLLSRFPSISVVNGNHGKFSFLQSALIPPTSARPAGGLSRADLILMAIACAIAVATLYYNQPLLPQMGASFGRSPAEATIITTITQFGYTAGLFFFVPLGDKFDSRRLVCGLTSLNILALFATAFAQTFDGLKAASFAIGLTTISAQILIPTVSGIAGEAERGRIAGVLLSGMSAGLLLSRAFSGFVGAHGRWRLVFMIAAIVDLVLITVVWLRLPASAARKAIPYANLLGSLWTLLKTEPTLRAACLTGFLMFGSYSAFWGALAGLLALPPYHFGSDISGAFGFVAIVGLLLSPMIGRMVDHHGPSPVLTAGTLSLFIAFLFVAGSAEAIVPLIAGAVLIDFGSRAGVVANQSRIYALSTEARSRLNTMFMTAFFLGGSIGTALASELVARLDWTGLAIVGGGFALAALVAHRATARRGHTHPLPPKL